MCLEKRKPILGTGSLEIGNAGSASTLENSENLLNIQASRIWERFRVSPPVARICAEHAFGWRVSA